MEVNGQPGKAMDTAAPLEFQLLDAAIQQFTQTTGITFEVVGRDIRVQNARGPYYEIDAMIQAVGYPELPPYAVEIKRTLTIPRLGLVERQLRNIVYARPNQKVMLVTDYINPKMAERLKEMDIAFVDLCGNAYINNPPIYVYIRGNKPTNQFNQWAIGRTPRPTRAFQATGLKVLFGFLTQPELLQATYREIAEVTDVALGTVGWVLTDLRDNGYLLETPEKKRRMIRRKDLIDQWIPAYAEKLRPKLVLGRYRAPDQKWWRQAEVDWPNTLWGGEIAAAKLTDYLQPEVATIYANEVPALFLLQNHLKKDPDGDVEILQKFWKGGGNQAIPDEPGIPNHVEEPRDLVPPLLIYADLVATGDARNIETANIIYDEYINRHIQQDR